MRHDVMDVPGEGEPVLVTGRLLPGLPLAAPFCHPFAPEPCALPQEHQDGQPRGAGEGPEQPGLITAENDTATSAAPHAPATAQVCQRLPAAAENTMASASDRNTGPHA